MWQERVGAVLLVVIGVANAFNGVLITVAPGRMSATYGVAVDDPALAVLLRHRAVLLAAVGIACVAAAFVSRWRDPAMVAVGLSMLSFVAITFSTSGAGAANVRLAATDVGLLGLLGLAAWLLRSG